MHNPEKCCLFLYTIFLSVWKMESFCPLCGDTEDTFLFLWALCLLSPINSCTSKNYKHGIYSEHRTVKNTH